MGPVMLIVTAHSQTDYIRLQFALTASRDATTVGHSQNEAQFTFCSTFCGLSHFGVQVTGWDEMNEVLQTIWPYMLYPLGAPSILPWRKHVMRRTCAAPRNPRGDRTWNVFC